MPRDKLRAVLARVVRGGARGGDARRFVSTFTVGRGERCDLRLLHESVAERHLQVVFDGRMWWVRDLGSAAGTFVNCARIQVMPLNGEQRVELGRGGPLLSLAVTSEAGDGVARDVRPRAVGRTAPRAPEPVALGTRLVERSSPTRPDGPTGQGTAISRCAVGRTQKKFSRRHHALVGAVLLVLGFAGAIIFYEAQKLAELRSTAARLFYVLKSVELEVKKLEEIALADPRLVGQLAEKRTRLKELEKEYDGFVQGLRAVGKLSEDERLILRVGRKFGECDVNLPEWFIPEVRRYIERWRSTEKLRNALRKAQRQGYANAIAHIFREKGLPPEYFYLALQESSFDDRAVGPVTRYGRAKGMWQFIALTARHYGLSVGPLHDERVYDPRDERFDWLKATEAAAAYLKDLHAGEAQGSGLLAMACYNWGADNVRAVVSRLPRSPEQRNFWSLLREKAVPQQTYDYVLYIFSAAVICENPRLFGFDVECPLAGESASAIGN